MILADLVTKAAANRWSAAVELPDGNTLGCWILTGRGRTERKPQHWRETFSYNGKEINKKRATKILADYRHDILPVRASSPMLEA